MKFEVDRDVFAESVAWVARSLPTRPSIPVLAGLMIHAEGESLTLSSFDYETSARVDVPARVHDEGTALISGRLLAEITRSLPHVGVSVATDDSSMELDCGSAHFTLQLLPTDDYPVLPAMPAETGKVASGDLAEAVSQVAVAAGRDELLPIFTGVRIEIDGETLSMLATDRYRMALKELTWTPVRSDFSGNSLVPAKVLSEAAKSMAGGESVSIALSQPGNGQGLIGLAGEANGTKRRITTRLLDGEFPKVRHLMDVRSTLTVRCSTSDLIDAAKRVALVAERNSPLRMVMGTDSITLEAASGDHAHASEQIEAVMESDGDPMAAAGFNPQYLLDALGALDAAYVNFSFTAAGKPCLLTGIGSLDGDPLLDYRHVIMLMRLPD
ncbi:DNA polymerase III, beta subunit [Raineyella antarctica]|uniref:Beta sliding clamp n=1 Tax=Raineyella antarctica TaxID=1577474 RepID=A0A1G6HTJ0_9ACTN|nr:DNA polymerase III subunit beta [Raineyella antarctica]SDB97504.1 DNA polymerase III, beta subunit [Raineyella antarctica]